jgi:hypothetical protein
MFPWKSAHIEKEDRLTTHRRKSREKKEEFGRTHARKKTWGVFVLDGKGDTPPLRKWESPAPTRAQIPTPLKDIDNLQNQLGSPKSRHQRSATTKPVIEFRNAPAAPQKERVDECSEQRTLRV